MRDSSITVLAQAVTVLVGLWFVTRYDDVEFAASRPEQP